MLTASAENGIRGFLSYFSCHPVVGSARTRWIHSDFAGVATNRLEREHPGAVGLFLQGCEGNINTCLVHQDEQQSLLALDVLADRYARQIRPGLAAGRPIEGDTVRCMSLSCRLTRAPLPRSELQRMLARHEAVLAEPGADDADPAVRRSTVYVTALRKELARQDAGASYREQAVLQGFRIGELLLVGAPFEVMVRYKQRLQAAFPRQTVLPLSLCNDTMGYAPERTSFAREDNYAARIVPYLLGYPPLAESVEDELVGAWTDLARRLQGSSS